ncbi:hypothetical protein TSMEX_010641 [Taenia solium]|eukprot:TsM_000466000 transcript=TsM_000466000 gene=TsM_000466000
MVVLHEEMEDVGRLLLRAFDGGFHAAIVLLVCLIGINTCLFVTYKVCCLRRARAVAQSENPKRRKKVKRNGRLEEINSSDGQTKPSSVTSQETANVLQELAEAMPLDQATSTDGGEDRESNEYGNDELKLGTDVDFNECVSCDQIVTLQGKGIVSRLYYPHNTKL